MPDQQAHGAETTEPPGESDTPGDALPRPANPALDWLNSHPRLFRTAIWGIVVASIITGGVLFLAGRLDPKDVGYTGVFLINLIGSASVVVPVPGLAAACAAAAPDAGLNIIYIGLLGAVGATVGELTGYMAGYGGQSFVQKSRFYGRVSGWVTRRGAVALFTLALVPNPVFDIAGIAAGSLGYPLSRFLLWVFLGKIIKFITVAYLCREGIDFLTRFM